MAAVLVNVQHVAYQVHTLLRLQAAYGTQFVSLSKDCVFAGVQLDCTCMFGPLSMLCKLSACKGSRPSSHCGEACCSCMLAADPL